MPSDPPGEVHVEFTPEFKRNLRALAKKYRHIRSDVQPVIDALKAGEVFGDLKEKTSAITQRPDRLDTPACAAAAGRLAAECVMDDHYCPSVFSLNT
jgi:hypothetical protein